MIHAGFKHLVTGLEPALFLGDCIKPYEIYGIGRYFLKLPNACFGCKAVVGFVDREHPIFPAFE